MTVFRNWALPNWAVWLLELGAALHGMALLDRHLRTCCTVPDRRFGAVLIATGAVVGSIRASVGEDPEKHFQMLQALPSGTPVVELCPDGLLRSGWLLGSSTMFEDDYIRYEEHKPGTTTVRARPMADCVMIQPLQSGSEPFYGPEMRPEIPQAIANIPNAALLSLFSIPVALLVGTASLLESELNRPILPDETTPGSIVRAGRTKPPGRHTRSEIIPSVSDELPDPLMRRHSVAVFDGSQGFARHRSSLAYGVSVLLVDRWSPTADIGVAEFLSERAVFGGPSNVLAPLGLKGVPPGVEFLSYEVLE